jgi:hypothetical protein
MCSTFRVVRLAPPKSLELGSAAKLLHPILTLGLRPCILRAKRSGLERVGRRPDVASAPQCGGPVCGGPRRLNVKEAG